jgi:hypothetical protein
MPSALSQYMQGYGTRLASLLQRPSVGYPLQEQGRVQPQQSVLMRPQRTAQVIEPPVGPEPIKPIEQHERVIKESSQKEGVTFRDVFKEAPAQVRQAEVGKLEQTLAEAGVTIDEAYDNMMAQLGTRPTDKLSREEKAMLLMEFGLNLMANSSGQAYGGDIGGAIGAAGITTLRSYRDMKAAKQADIRAYDRSALEIEAGRAKAKGALADSAIDAIAKEREAGIKGEITTKDGKMYLYRSDGSLMLMRDPETGEPLKADQRADMSGPKFETEYRYNQFMAVYGVDPKTGKPLTGAQLNRVKKQALEFASERGRQEDPVRDAERSADDFIRANADLFRDMTPEQVNAYRNRIADERRARFSAGRDRRPSSKIMEFATEAEAQSALDRGEIVSGDEVIIGGRRARVD